MTFQPIGRTEPEELELLRTLFQGAPDAIVVTNATGRIILVNAQTEELFGYRRNELIGKSVEVLVPPRSRGSHERQRSSYVENPHSRAMRGNRELTAVSKDGREIPVEIWLSPVGDAETRLVVSSIRDVSEKRKLQAQLLQAQKMEVVGQVVAGVAHDFNNLLTVISSFSKFVEDAVTGDPQASEDIQEVLRAANQARNVVAQLMTFSRGQVINAHVVELNEVMRGVDRMLRRVLREDIELVTLVSDQPLRAHIDPTRFEQILMNLTLNARDAMPNGGKLTLELGSAQLGESRLEHSGVPPGEFVVLAVTDNGSGMAPEVRDRVFEPFFTTKERGRGTGLGLAVCHGIIKQLGGHVWVYSEPGVGTTFKIYFPRVYLDETRESMRPALASPTGTETILVVEDEPAVRALAERSLTKRGFKVVTAENGLQALERLESAGTSIDLLLTDVIMPGMSGKELARQLALTRPELKVVFMSGYTDDTIVRHGVLEEGVVFVQKPFTPEVLVRKVRDALDSA